MSTNKHILKCISVFGSIQGLNILLGLVRNKVVAILLGPQGVGLISIYNTASTLLQNTTNFGIQISGVREISRAVDEGNREYAERYIRIVRLWSLLVALLGGVVCMMMSGVLSRWAFSSDEYIGEFMLLSPVVALAAITGGETAILKATRRLHQLAKISILGVVGALIVSIPLYITLGIRGIIPSLILVAIIQMVLTMSFSFRHNAYRIKWDRRELREGSAIITVGLAFVASGIFVSGADFIVRTFLSDISVDIAGLYNSGYMIVMTYAGMVFAALEPDYFPHLSAVCGNRRRMICAVNRQIDMSMVVVGPMLACLILAMPFIIPLLFSSEFLPVVRMAQVAALAMYFRCIYLPVAYTMLAKGDSRSFLSLEFFYSVILVCGIILCYNQWGFFGTGIALALVNIIESTCVVLWCTWRYRLFLALRVLSFAALQFLIGVAILGLVVLNESHLLPPTLSSVVYWLGGTILIILSASLSVKKLSR